MSEGTELEIREMAKKGRRSHRKSKLGCLQCKARKTKPACDNCMTRGVECTFRVTASAAPAPVPGATQTATPSSTGAMDRTMSWNTDEELPDIDLAEMKLLHNYSTLTAYTLARHPILHTVWRISVPEIAFSSMFVMRAVLTISALHLAHTHPAERDYYISLATQHHDLALRQAVSALADESTENGNALFIFSALTCFIACAKPRKADDLLIVGENGISEWLSLFRGTRAIIQRAGLDTREGPLTNMFSLGHRRSIIRSQTAPQPQPALTELESFLTETVSDPIILRTYISAVEELAKSYNIALDGSGNSVDTSDVFIWIFELSEDFLALLTQRTQEALCIFAFYCPVLKQLDSMWWMQGCAGHLISLIWQALDQEHRAWIQWPIERLGGIAS